MNDRGPGPGEILGGIFLILFGLCATLLGGGCSVMMIGAVFDNNGGGLAPLLLLSLGILAGGLMSIWAGFKLFTGRIR